MDSSNGGDRVVSLEEKNKKQLESRKKTTTREKR